MKKAWIAMMTAALLGCGAVASAETLTGTAQGFGGDVTVSVELSERKIQSVSVTGEQETPELGGKAAESLAVSLLNAGSTAGVDAISGSTMTSDAVFTAMDDCLAQAAQ